VISAINSTGHSRPAARGEVDCGTQPRCAPKGTLLHGFIETGAVFAGLFVRSKPLLQGHLRTGYRVFLFFLFFSRWDASSCTEASWWFNRFLRAAVCGPRRHVQEGERGRAGFIPEAGHKLDLNRRPSKMAGKGRPHRKRTGRNVVGKIRGRRLPPARTVFCFAHVGRVDRR